MAFPSTAATVSLANAWNRAMDVAGYVKTQADTLRTRSLAGDVGSSSILGYLVTLAEARVELVAIAALPGIGAYAQEQVNNPSLNVAAEFATMIAAMDACRDWVIANFPQSGGFLLAVSFNGGGRTVDRQFSTASLAGFRTQLDALIATIA